MEEKEITESERQAVILDRFREIVVTDTDPVVARVASIVVSNYEEKGINLFCYSDARNIVEALIINGVESLHFWYARGHVVPYIKDGNSRLILIECIGHKGYGFEPGIIVVNKGDRHYLFGDPDTGQKVTYSLTMEILRDRAIGFPTRYGSGERSVTSLDQIFAIE